MPLKYKPVADRIIKELESFVGPKNVLTDPADLICYARDHSPRKYSVQFEKRPEVVVVPETSMQVQDVVQLANRELVPITSRGGGAGFSGNAMPWFGGILLETNKMNKIITINEDEMVAICQTGIGLDMLNRACMEKGFIFADDPASQPTNTVGGRIGTNGVGSRANRYGQIKDMVKGLEVVLPTGELIRVGGRYWMESSTGGGTMTYLWCGAFGTLGVVTEATLRIFPKPEKIWCRVYAYEDLGKALKAAKRISRTGIIYTMLAVNTKHISVTTNRMRPEVSTPTPEAKVTVVLEGTNEEVDGHIPRVVKILEEEGGEDLGPEYGKATFDERHDYYSAITGVDHALWQDEECSIPLASSGKIMDEAVKILDKYGISGPDCYNAEMWTVSPPIFSMNWRIDERNEDAFQNYFQASREIAVDKVLEVGGAISCAHGVGKNRLQNYLRQQLGYGFEVLKAIKKALDPNFIMNPGCWGFDVATE